MRIAVVTYQRSANYGAFLQAYALSHYLGGLGHEVRVIDYVPEHRARRLRIWSGPWFGLHPQALIGLHRKWALAKYCEQYLPLTARQYSTLDELCDAPPEADAYICGSDQIWNPKHIGGSFDAAYFAEFGARQVRRIAYAASFGTAELSAEHTAALPGLTANLDHISVREASGCDIISQVTGRACQVVLDPTLLVSDYSPLMHHRRIREPYLLVYSIVTNEYFGQVLELAKQATGLECVSIVTSARFWRHGPRFRFCDPGDWLDLFANASAIVTDSFHGTAFALNFRKPFLSLSAGGMQSERNSRITDLLDLVGLQGRFIGSRDQVGQASILARTPDWTAVEKRLAKAKSESAGYLERALGSAA